MSYTKLIYLISFIFIFTACEDSPKAVGVYDAPPRGTIQKATAMDESKLKISIFNIGNFGGAGKVPSEKTRHRAGKIKDTLKTKIFKNNDIQIFLDIVGEDNGYEIFNSHILNTNYKCGKGIHDRDKVLKRITMICHHPDLEMSQQNLTSGLDDFSDFYGDNSPPPAHGLKLTHKEFGYEFYLVVLDFSKVAKAQEREDFTLELAEAISKRSAGLPVLIVGDWRNNSEAKEINDLYNILNNELTDMKLFEASEQTVIDTDVSSPVVKKYNNIVFSSKVWSKSTVGNLGACSDSIEDKENYKWDIGENCPTSFVLDR